MTDEIYSGYTIETYNELQIELSDSVRKAYVKNQTLHLVLKGSGRGTRGISPKLENTVVSAIEMIDWDHFKEGSFETPLLSLMSYAKIPFRVLNAFFGDEGLLRDGDYGQAIADVLKRDIKIVIPRSKPDQYDWVDDDKDSTLGGTIMRASYTPNVE